MGEVEKILDKINNITSVYHALELTTDDLRIELHPVLFNKIAAKTVGMNAIKGSASAGSDHFRLFGIKINTVALDERWRVIKVLEEDQRESRT